MHGLFLDDAVGVFAGDAGLREGEQDALAEDQAAHAIQIGFHAVGVDQQLFDHAGKAVEGEVERDGGVRPDDAFHRRVADIAFVPQGDVFHGWQGVAADHAREAANVFGEDRVLFMGHGAGAFLPFGEKFLRFAHFGALQMAYFGGEVFHGRRDDAEGAEEASVAVARDDLGGDRFRRQVHFFGDVVLNGRRGGGVGADGAGDHAHGDIRARGNQAFPAAFEHGVVAGEFEAEGGGFGVDAVGAADADGFFVLEAAFFKGGQNAVHILEQNVGGLRELDGEAGVDDITAGHALVDEARFGADAFGDVGEEGDDVVFDFFFDLVDFRDAELGLLAGFRGDTLGDDAELFHRLGSVDFDIQPDFETVFRFPDVDHVGAGVTRDHWRPLSLDLRPV